MPIPPFFSQKKSSTSKTANAPIGGLRSWWNSTGGIVYHARALRYSHRLWLPFREQVGAWLGAWSPPERSLILFGPSGGYTITAEFLERFDSILCIDPDPLAKRIFLRRFSSLRNRIVWRHDDVLDATTGRFSTTGLEHLLSDYPHSALLFCNLIGQLQGWVQRSDSSQAQKEGARARFYAWKKRLSELLGGPSSLPRSWASYHDRLSGERAPDTEAPFLQQLGNLRIQSEVLERHREHGATFEDRSSTELIRLFYTGTAGQTKTCPQEKGHLNDHETGGLFPGHERLYWSWEIMPGYYHLIEGISSRRADEQGGAPQHLRLIDTPRSE